MRQGGHIIIEGRKRVLAWMLAAAMVLSLMPAMGMRSAAADNVTVVTGEETIELDAFGTEGVSAIVRDVKTLLENEGLRKRDCSYEITPDVKNDAALKGTAIQEGTGMLSIVVPKKAVADKKIVIEASKTEQDVNDSTKYTKTVYGRYTINIKKIDASENIRLTLNPGSVVYGTPLKDITPTGFYINKATGLSKSVTIEWADALTTAPKNEKDKDGTYKDNAKYKYTFSADDISGNGTTRVYVIPASLTVIEEPTVADVAYDPLRPLEKIAIKGASPTAMVGGKSTSVPGKWLFKYPQVIPKAGQRTEEVVYTPTDSENYASITRYVTFTVKKITPKIQKVTTSAIQLGESLKASSLIGDYGGVKGTLRWENESIVPTIADSGKTDYEWFFEPDDTTNYEIVRGKAKVTIKKRENPPVAIADSETWSVSKGVNRVSEVGLPKDWQWRAEDAKKEIKNPGDVVVVVAEYVGEDKDNYENISRIVKLEKSKTCYHGIITFYGGIAPTCTEFGFQGKKICQLCGAYMGPGEAVEPHGHVYVSSVVEKPTVLNAGIREYNCIHNCGSGYREVIASLADNSAGIITFKPALQNNVTTAAVIPSPSDIEIAIEGNVSKAVTIDMQPMTGGVPRFAKTVKVTLNEEVKNSLETFGASKLTLKTSHLEVDFNAKALQNLKQKITGGVTVSISIPEEIEERPSYDVSLLKFDAAQGGDAKIENFESTGITVRIPYTPQQVDSTGSLSSGGTLEDVKKIKGYYKDEAGNKVYISDSYYDEYRSEVVIPTTHLSIYGVGYRGGNPLGPKTVLKLASTAKKKSIKLKWNKIEGAKKYVVYGARYGKKAKKLKTLTKSTTFTHKKLKKGTAYKYYVKVYLDDDNVASKTIYVYTTGGRYGNQTKMTPKSKELTIQSGKAKTIKVTYKKSGKLRKFTSYVRYASSDTSIATVSSKGKVTAAGKGECTIYIFGMNGYKTSVKVTVTE